MSDAPDDDATVPSAQTPSPSPSPSPAPPGNRAWALIRLRSGDYFVPSNDRDTLWRVCTYEEDGSLVRTYEDGTEEEVKGIYWMTMKFAGTFEQASALLDRSDTLDDFLRDERWQGWAYLFKTRRDALADIFG